MSIPATTSPVSNPYSGVFGNGQIQMFINSGTFTVPAGVTFVRVRVWGAGGNSGGGGGGFAMRAINLSGTSSVAVTVGASGSPGGTSSFGAFVSATGGLSSASPTGGSGIGGDVNYSGGTGNLTGGGGGAAGLFGNGGGAASAQNGCAGGGSNSAQGGNGFTGTGAVVQTNVGIPASAGDVGRSIDFIATGGGGANTAGVSFGVNGGGGGSVNPSFGGFPGGGGGNGSVSGRGLVIVEY